jgi:hypothetical protein
MSMPLKVPFVRKHVHSWKLLEKRPLSGGGLECARECTDPACGRRQIATVQPEDVVPDPYLACADAAWEDGKLGPRQWPAFQIWP